MNISTPRVQTSSWPCAAPRDGQPLRLMPKPASKAGFGGIGATGFEPATFRPPAECATRLRHASRCR
jgi:hypothetical protein